MAAPPSPPAPGAPSWSWHGALACLLGLVALCLAWELWLAPTGRGTLALKALPLLAAVPGLLRQRLHTCRWLSLALWLYVGEGLVRATSEGGLSQRLAMLEVVLAGALFAACVGCIRARTTRHLAA